jgi:hypothetical protein
MSVKEGESELFAAANYNLRRQTSHYLILASIGGVGTEN